MWLCLLIDLTVLANVLLSLISRLFSLLLHFKMKLFSHIWACLPRIILSIILPSKIQKTLSSFQKSSDCYSDMESFKLQIKLGRSNGFKVVLHY